ncbi:hypothetical protein NM22_18540 [Vibrio tubiashii]|nr:hypothetical protein NM22_18540 [Vibrio tubiashii]
MKVIFNADDFGLTQGVNNGIVQSHLDGVVNSTTMLVGMPAQQHAVALAKELPTLKVGLHLRFTLGSPLTKSKNLCDENGEFFKYDSFWKQQHFTSKAIYNECIAQVEAFLDLGLELSHIDSHHHAHTHPLLLPIVADVAKKYSVPLRGQNVEHLRYTFSDYFYDQNVEFDGLLRHILDRRDQYDVLEVMCHPAIVDKALLESSGYAVQREKELQVLTNEKLAILLVRHSIEVTDYSTLTTQHQ